MKTLANTSKIVLATAIFGMALTACDRRPADQLQTGATSSSTATPTAETSSTVATGTNSPGVTAPATSESATSPTASVSDSTTSGGASTSAAVSGAANTVGTVVEDSVITTKLKTAILADMTMKDSNVSVDTKNGTVMLTGSVANDMQKDHVAKIAQALEGVKTVDNKLASK